MSTPATPSYAADTAPAPAAGNDRPMRGQVALIAGASKGIGATTAEAFADAGGQSAGVKPSQMYRQGQPMQASNGEDTP